MTGWEELLARLDCGTILVTGGPGHSELARYLLGQLDRAMSCVALVDASLDSPAIGVPGCLGLALTRPWRAPAALWFVGELDPRSRPLSAVVGTARLVEAARQEGASAVIVDGGQTRPDPGGCELQQHLALASGVDQVVTVTRNGELSLLARVLATPDREVYRVPPPAGLRSELPEDPEPIGANGDDDSYRQRRFAAHFREARVQRFALDRILPRPSGPLEEAFEPGRLVGLIGEDGTCLALGVVEALARDHLAVLTPCARRREVQRIERGGLRLDPASWPGVES